MANITEINGNIFESGLQTIVNTVNCVGVMGKGIALEYRHMFPEMYTEYKKKCDRNQLRPGLLYLWTKSNPWVLNFPTKNHWRKTSKTEYIENGLVKFAETFQSKGITSIAFPELGTSQGGLQWEVVRELMYKYLEPLPNLEVEIYHYDPTVKDSQIEKFLQKVHRFKEPDYIHYINLSKKQSRLIMDAVSLDHVRSMQDLKAIPGIGDKSIQKIYDFLSSQQSSRLITDLERRPKLELEFE